MHKLIQTSLALRQAVTPTKPPHIRRSDLPSGGVGVQSNVLDSGLRRNDAILNSFVLARLSIIILGMSVRGWAATGVADIKGTAENSQIRGTVNFTDTAAGLQIKAKLSGLPPGSHAFHIHEFGSCADLGKSAGSHYNPLGAPHGQV